MNRILRSFVTVTVVAAGIVAANAFMSAATDGNFSIRKLLSGRLFETAKKTIEINNYWSEITDDDTLRVVVGTTGNIDYMPDSLECKSADESLLTVKWSGNYTALKPGLDSIIIVGGTGYNDGIVRVRIKSITKEDSTNLKIKEQLDGAYNSYKTLSDKISLYPMELPQDVKDSINTINTSYGMNFGDLDEATIALIQNYSDSLGHVVDSCNMKINNLRNLAYYYIGESDETEVNDRITDALSDIQDELAAYEAQSIKDLNTIISYYYNMRAVSIMTDSINSWKRYYNQKCFGIDTIGALDYYVYAKPVSEDNYEYFYRPDSVKNAIEVIWNAPSLMVGTRFVSKYWDFAMVNNMWYSSTSKEQWAAGRSKKEKNYGIVWYDNIIVSRFNAFVKNGSNANLVNCNLYANERVPRYKDSIDAWLPRVKQATDVYLNDRNYNYISERWAEVDQKLKTLIAYIETTPDSVKKVVEADTVAIRKTINVIDNDSIAPTVVTENKAAWKDTTEIVRDTLKTSKYYGMTKAQIFNQRLIDAETAISDLESKVNGLVELYDANKLAYSTLNKNLQTVDEKRQRYIDVINTELVKDPAVQKEAVDSLKALYPTIYTLGMDLIKSANSNKTTVLPCNFLGVIAEIQDSLQKRVDAIDTKVNAYYYKAIGATNAKVQAENDSAYKITQDSLTVINNCFYANTNKINNLIKYHTELNRAYLDSLFDGYKFVIAPFDSARVRKFKVDSLNVELGKQNLQYNYHYDNKWLTGTEVVAKACEKLNAISEKFYEKASQEDVDYFYGQLYGTHKDRVLDNLDNTSDAIHNFKFYSDPENKELADKLDNRLAAVDKYIEHNIDSIAKMIATDPTYHQHVYPAADTIDCEIMYYAKSAYNALLECNEEIKAVMKIAVEKENSYSRDSMLTLNNLLLDSLDKVRNDNPIYKNQFLSVESGIWANKTAIDSVYENGIATEFLYNRPGYMDLYDKDIHDIDSIKTLVFKNDSVEADLSDSLAIVRKAIAWLESEDFTPSIVKPYKDQIKTIGTAADATDKKISTRYAALWTLVDSTKVVAALHKEIDDEIDAIDAILAKVMDAQRVEDNYTVSNIQTGYSELKGAWDTYYTQQKLTDDSKVTDPITGNETTARQLREDIYALNATYAISKGDPNNFDTFDESTETGIAEQWEINHYSIWGKRGEIGLVFGKYLNMFGTLGDVNGDHVVNYEDIVIVATEIGAEEYDYRADMNGDKTVNSVDIMLMINKMK